MATEAIDPRTQLRAAGMRVTDQRVSVLEALRAHPHAPAETVAAVSRSQLGRISTQAVYDVLNACVAAGLVRRIEPAGSPAVFETRTADNHHHLVCRSCGTIVDVDCATGAAPCLTPNEPAGFVVDEAEVTYWGQCSDCRGAEALNPSPSITRPTAIRPTALEATR